MRVPGVGIGVGFNRGGGSSVPPSVLDSWYASLAVKPSEGLWTDLKIMADGMNTDGDWAEMDLIGITAAMETNEQRLRPLKTTSGDDCTIEGSPGFSVDGIDNPTLSATSGINLKWNPTDNGVKYILDSAYFCAFGRTKVNSTANLRLFGCFSVSGTESDPIVSNSNILFGVGTSIIRHLTSSNYFHGDSPFSATTQKTGLIVGSKTFMLGFKRQESSGVYKLVNNISTFEVNNSIGMPIADIGFMGEYYSDLDNPVPVFTGNTVDQFYGRGYIAGSGSIDHNRVAGRLNTFFAARGLSIANY